MPIVVAGKTSNPIDRNPSSINRNRRNWQRATQGALTDTISLAPNGGGALRTLFVGANSGPITNTATATEFDLSFTFAAGALNAAGRLVHVRAWFTVTAGPTDTVSLQIQLGSTPVWTVTVIPVSGWTSMPILMDVYLMVVGGQIQATGSMFLNALAAVGMPPTTLTSINLAASQVLEVVAQWSAASMGDSITMDSLVLFQEN